MEISDAELTPLIPTSDISTPIHDTRQPYEKKLAVYFILASIIFERMAYYSVANNLAVILQSNQTVGWTSQQSSTASLTFVGK